MDDDTVQDVAPALVRDDDDDDPVIAEYPVYAAQDLAGCLHLFQYPLRTASNPYQATSRTLYVTEALEAPKEAPSGSNPKFSAATVAPSSLPAPGSRFFMDMRLSTTGSDSFRGGVNNRTNGNGNGAAGRDLLDSSTNDQDGMNRNDSNGFGLNDGVGGNPDGLSYSLESLPAKLGASYAVALFYQGQVHLTPMTSIQQLTPKLHGRSNEQQYVSGLATEGAPTTGAMHAHLERQLNRLRSAMLNSNRATAKQIDLYDADSVDSATVARRLLAPTTHVGLHHYPRYGGASAQQSQGPPYRALPNAASHFFPLEQCGARDESFRLARPTLLRYAGLTHPIHEQVKFLLQTANQITLRQAMTIVTVHAQDPAAAHVESTVLQSLQRYAVLAHGVWIGCYDPTFRGSLAFVREHVLLLFALSGDGRITAESALVSCTGHVFLERGVRAVLAAVADLDPATRTWTLKHSNAGAEAAWIAANYRDDAEAQRMQWTRRAPDIMANLETVKKGRPIPLRYLKLPLQVSAGTPTSTPAAAGTRGASANGVPLGSAAASASPTRPTGSPIPRTQPGATAAGAGLSDDQQYATAVTFIKLTVAALGVINREKMKNHLRVSVQNPATILHGCAGQLQKAAQETLMTFTQNTWILKSAADPAIDQARRSLVIAMRALPSFTLKDITAEAEKILNDSLRVQNPGAAAAAIPVSVVTTVVKELALYQPADRLWHVKTGNDSLDPPPRGTLKS
jgi:hypothetical protein